MKSTLVALIAIFMLTLSTAHPETTMEQSRSEILDHPSGSYRYVARELIIRVRKGISVSALNSCMQPYGASALDAAQIDRFGFTVATFPDGADILQIQSELKLHPLIESVNLNYVGTFATVDPYYDEQWALRKIKAPEGWEAFTKGDTSVVVAILDSGYSPHEDLPESRIIEDSDDYNFTEGAEDYKDRQDHAMAMAGIIGAGTDNLLGIAGVAWYPKLWFVKVGTSEGDYGTVLIRWLTRGIDCVVDAAIANTHKRYIINTSLGIMASPEDIVQLEHAVARADSHDVLIVAAAGNTITPDGKDDFVVEYPARFSRMDPDNHYCNVISVGAVDSFYAWADYSNYLGSDSCEVYVDLSAPGGMRLADTVVTFCSDTNVVYKYRYGTSVATAHVTGAAALVLSHNPFLSLRGVKNTLKESTFDPSDPPGWGYSNTAYWCYDPIPHGGQGSYLDPMCDDNVRCGYSYEYNQKKGTGILNIHEALSRVKAPTISGNVDSDMLWSGEIIVVGDVTVTAGNTLTIEPGTTVRIARGDLEDSGDDTTKVEIDIQGTLVAGSIGGDEIVFRTRHLIGAGPRDWLGITFTSSSSGNVLNNVVIRNAATAITNHAPVELHECTISDANAASLELHGDAFIDDSTIYLTCDTSVESGDTLRLSGSSDIYISPVDSNNTLSDPLKVEILVNGHLEICGDVGDPIRMQSYADEPAPGDWNWLEFSGANSSGSLSHIYLSHGYHGIKSYKAIGLSNATISYCEVNGIFIMGNQANGVTISNCHIHHNGAIGISITDCDYVTIDTCVVTDNYYGVSLSDADLAEVNRTFIKYNTCDGVKAQSSNPCTFDWCVIEDNDQHGIYLSQSSGVVSYTKIWKNEVNGLYCAGSNTAPTVGHCKIEQNLVGVKISSGARPLLGLLMMGGSNAIYNQQWYVYSSPSYSVYAENNWWGTGAGEAPNPQKFKGAIDYDPYLESDPVVYLFKRALDKRAIFSLAQNYPNPFRSLGATTILYSIPQDNERVVLRIYDVAGRRVRTLVHDIQPRGQYIVRWDGRNDRGYKVSAGIYFYRIIVGRKTMSKKLIVLE